MTRCLTQRSLPSFFWGRPSSSLIPSLLVSFLHLCSANKFLPFSSINAASSSSQLRRLCRYHGLRLRLPDLLPSLSKKLQQDILWGLSLSSHFPHRSSPLPTQPEAYSSLPIWRNRSFYVIQSSNAFNFRDSIPICLVIPLSLCDSIFV